MKKSLTTKSGYSLVELMVAVAILAIVAAVAIPLYQRYVLEAEVASIDETISEIRESLNIFVATHGKLPVSNKEAGIPGHSAGFDLELTHLNEKTGGLVATVGGRYAFGYELLIDHGRLDMNCIPADKSNLPSNRVTYQDNVPEECKSAPARVTAGNSPGPAQAQQTQPQQAQQIKPQQTQSQQPALTSCAADEEQVLSQNGQSVCVKKCGAGQNRQNCIEDTVPGVAVQPVPEQVATVDVTICLDNQHLDKDSNQCVDNSTECPAGFEKAASTGPISVQFADATSIMHSSNGNAQVSTVKRHDDLSSAKMIVTTGEAGISCHLCRGPKFICERSHATQSCSVENERKTGYNDQSFLQDSTRGTAANPYVGCMNEVENLRDGSRYVTRHCATLSDMQKAFNERYKDHNDCTSYDTQNLVDKHFTCGFGCIGDNCNIETVPEQTVTQALLDSITLPAAGSQPVCVPKK